MQDSLCAGDAAKAPTYTGHNRNEENGGAMPILTDEIKEFIVKGLASFETAAEVAEAVKSTFGVEISRRHVYAYDPKCPQPPAPRWRDLHAAARAAYLSELAEIDHSSQPTTTAGIHRLEAQGWARRDPDPSDARATLVSITPAGHETVHLKSGMTTAVDLPNLTQGQAGTLVLTPSDPTSPAPFVAALRVTRGRTPSADTAFVPATGPVGQRASVADNRMKASTLSLAAPTADATVKITTSASTDGGTPVTKTVTVKAGTTVAMAPPPPSTGSGTFAVTVEPVSGGPVYASRMLSLPQDGEPSFTLQGMPDDGGTVAVPDAAQDPAVLQR